MKLRAEVEEAIQRAADIIGPCSDGDAFLALVELGVELAQGDLMHRMHAREIQEPLGSIARDAFREAQGIIELVDVADILQAQPGAEGE